MVDTKTDSSSTPLSDDPANPTKGLSAKPNTASHPAGAEPGLDTLFHRTSLRLTSARFAVLGRLRHAMRASGSAAAANVVTASEAREPRGYGDNSNRSYRVHCRKRAVLQSELS